MFVDENRISAGGYLCLLLMLNQEATYDPYQGPGPYATCGELIQKLAPFSVDLTEIEELERIGLIRSDDRDLNRDSIVKLRTLGAAFLVNKADKYLKIITDRYGEVPEKLTASLIPLLDLQRVPAADRYVNTSHNATEFKTLEESLEAIRRELIKDQNKNDIPLKEKRAIIAELEGLTAQIRGGFVRLSDLTARARPMLKNIADVCKDIIVVATAASTALAAITAILQKLF